MLEICIASMANNCSGRNYVRNGRDGQVEHYDRKGCQELGKMEARLLL